MLEHSDMSVNMDALAQKGAEAHAAALRSKRIERAIENLIHAAYAIAAADPDRTHPDLHRALSRLERAKSS